MTLTKAQIVEALFAKNIFTKTQSAQIIDTLFELIKQSLQNGEDVLISGFGKFSVKEKQARRGRNPQTGEPMTLPPRKVVTFKCSGVLRAGMNGGVTETVQNSEPVSPEEKSNRSKWANSGVAPEKVEPQVTIAVAQLYQVWLTPWFLFLNFPKEGRVLLFSVEYFPPEHFHWASCSDLLGLGYTSSTTRADCQGFSGNQTDHGIIAFSVSDTSGQVYRPGT